MSRKTKLDLVGVDAVLLDLDGVITPTADIHRRAWAELFTELFTRMGIEPSYSDRDYFTYLDGKPRFDGVRHLLASRKLTLAEGEPEDPAHSDTVMGLGNTKNEIFETIVRSEGVQAYPGSVEFINHVASLDIALAVVSSSRNARLVLDAANLTDRFALVMDGKDAAARHLAGKPAPDTFVAAAEDLGAVPARAIVCEDALSGVTAARAGGFAVVVGVDRGAGSQDLIHAGADLVVSDLGELL